MSAYTLSMIRCDGRILGSSCEVEISTLLGLREERLRLKRRGWIRRNYEQQQIDLCPECKPRADALPKVAWSAGRPPRKRIA